MKFSKLELDQSEECLVRVRLLTEVTQLIKDTKLTQKKIARKLCISQPKVSNLMKENISLFSMETLLDYLCILGCEIQIKIKKPNSKRAIFRRRGRISIR